MKLSRRAALGATAALPAASLLPATASADAHSGPPPQFRTFMLGDMEVTVLLAGQANREGDMQETFGMNVDAETFAQASRDAFIPTDQAVFFFQPTVVRTGGEVVLFDTGLNVEGITGVLGAAGFAPEDVTQLVITHMHPDHIGGLSEGGTPTFANARHITGETEMSAWQANPNDPFTEKVAPLADQFELIAPGAEIVSGITAVDMFGHTPGHMGYRMSSGDAQAMLCADMTNHYVWSLAHPDWEVRFDMDKEAAAATRRRVLGEIATDRIPMIGYHMPHPAVGYVETAGDGFRWVPESYQLML
ncbi:MBL fold metallo-hydrolase [Jannaschia aquimarina]|uniref:AiiA_3 protein n=1 Tax=Jannaschia aquimarina TaxID=935700 RepID=A0A0D1D6M6_9RHOB|nr:MBL fold metallo-hydrolase [Jannaschia aquimarina]KIT15623.1 N-acyl homoserine lactonase [Jannaschia aquimarina]SNT02786.1 Glyoxylase, beta-lactamase superfamily II [Jannaschia aquimarina]